MKKAFLSVMISILILSSASVAQAGSLGIRLGDIFIPFGSLIYSDEKGVPLSNASVGLLYQFSNELSGSAGIAFASSPKREGSSSADVTLLGFDISGFYTMGSGPVRPRIGADIGFTNFAPSYGDSETGLLAALLFGGEAKLTPSLSLTADIKLIEALDISGGGNSTTYIGILNSGAIGLQWYL